MNTSTIRRQARNGMKPLALALVLTLPGAAAIAASMDDVVKTRTDQNIQEQYGRDSVYAFSPDAKPLKPEQTGSHDANIFGKVKNYAADFWHKTEGFAASTWDKTTGLFTDHTAGPAAAQPELQPYGRAGGYVGAGRIAVLESEVPFRANGTGDAVMTGEAAMGNAADTRASEAATRPMQSGETEQMR
jgi:hypothetical protein